MNNMNSFPEKINDLKLNKSAIKEVSAQAKTNEIVPNSQTNSYPIKFSNMKKIFKILWQHSHRTKRFFSITIILFTIEVGITAYNAYTNVYDENYNNFTYYYNIFINHFNLITFVAPLFLTIGVTFFETYYLIDYINQKENSKKLTKILVIAINATLLFDFSVELMAQPWRIIEPIITMCTAIFIPYVAWLLKKYGSNGKSPADELLKYEKLLDKGRLTQEEFDNQKAKLLSK